VLDEMANFAFWVGLMKGMPERYANLKDTMDFRVAKSNFVRAAHTGMATSLEWEGQLWSAPKLVLEKLLPIAEAGLGSCGISGDDVDRYLGVIHDRCVRQRSGSRWMVQNFQRLRKAYGRGMASSLITEAMVEHQSGELPVHFWDDIHSTRIYPRPFAELYAKDVMSTDLFTVKEEDPVILTERIMRWRKIRHLPVENDQGELIGILTHSQLSAWSERGKDPFEMVREVMVPQPVCAAPDASMASIRTTMIEKGIGCVPITVEQHLVGMITDTDVRRLWAESEKEEGTVVGNE
jgi:CBS domain-containing protein